MHEPEIDKVQALLASAQSLRTHWSGAIIQIMNFNIVANVAVWTIFFSIIWIILMISSFGIILIWL